ncbi:MAG: hypothetical protein NC548_15460 [Lachnospiraceae bacterium]|nr:hypothetical protein [Lachnospiraceae bacterium]
MKRFLVIKPNESVEVLIMKHKLSNKYSYINITKQHICPCQFDSIEDAIKDMDKKKLEGKIIEYKEIR